MKFSIDDKRVTQYAIGELEDEQLIQEIELQLESDEALTKAVEDLRAVAGMLEKEFNSEPNLEWSEDEKAKAVEAPKKPSKLIQFPYALSSTIAAVLVLGFMLSINIGTLEKRGSDSFAEEILSAPRSEIDIQSFKQTNNVKPTGASQPPTLSSYSVDGGNSIGADPFSDKKEIVADALLAEPVVTSGSGSVKTAPMQMNLRKVKGSKSAMPSVARAPASSAPFGTAKRSAPAAKEAYRDKYKAAKKLSQATGFTGYVRSHDEDITVDPFAPVVSDEKGFNREAYDSLKDNAFKDPKQEALSTFSVDVDTASYSNLRRMLKEGRLPPAGAVRIEEMINYFPYQIDGPADRSGDPFKIHTELAESPWSDNYIMKVAIKGYEVPEEDRPDANLVFLLDVSGSMNSHNKLPLLKKSLELLIKKLGDNDRVAIVVYAGASGLALPSTTANNKETILHALTQLDAGGSTNGGAGIELAYKTAEKYFIKGGNNRVILCTDGDFNVGTSDRGSLLDLIKAKAKSGVFLSILGFGTGNYQDATMEELSNSGNGNYAYIDELKEARKVLVEQAGSTLLTIAKDVKIQVEFNPQSVSAYRLIGYANRKLNAEDFNDDKKDAGEIGAGHTVTALYEIVPAGVEVDLPKIDDLKYQSKKIEKRASFSDEICTVKFRYKKPDEDKSSLIKDVVKAEVKAFDKAGEHLRFASGVAGFGMLLRDSKHKGDLNYKKLNAILEAAKGADQGGYRSELIRLLEKAENLSVKE